MENQKAITSEERRRIARLLSTRQAREVILEHVRADMQYRRNRLAELVVIFVVVDIVCVSLLMLLGI